MNELLKKQRQLIAIYLVWVFINIIVWVMSSGDTSDFWPFQGSKLTREYDFSEFLVYAIGPAVVYFAYNLFNKKA